MRQGKELAAPEGFPSRSPLRYVNLSPRDFEYGSTVGRSVGPPRGFPLVFEVNPSRVRFSSVTVMISVISAAIPGPPGAGFRSCLTVFAPFVSFSPVILVIVLTSVANPAAPGVCFRSFSGHLV